MSKLIIITHHTQWRVEEGKIIGKSHEQGREKKTQEVCLNQEICLPEKKSIHGFCSITKNAT